MPEFLAPGVYVEETPFGGKPIEGVSTTTTGFIGPCRYGPVTEVSEVITSLGAFECRYAGRAQLEFTFDGHRRATARVRQQQCARPEIGHRRPGRIFSSGRERWNPGRAGEYRGREDAERTLRTGLKQFEDVKDISIVAAPGSTADYQHYFNQANSIFDHLIAHATRMRYRIAILDCPPGQSVADVRKVRAKLDSAYAAFYYPWITVLDPVTRQKLALPPSGFVAGIYVRNDVSRGVHKAPANEVVHLAIGLEQTLNKQQQEVLNPEGINCFRFFEGSGFPLWGARTISSDPEWKYVNLRRYVAYLEHSIDKGTQWAVFEPNGEALWVIIRRAIEAFLLNEFRSGALLGAKPEEAYFVKCDRSTMAQDDLDNGRLVVLIGIAPLRPAEFVIFRIGQWTADRKT